MQLPLSQLDDNSLLQKNQDGNHHAFAELVNRHSERFYCISYRFLLNKSDAEDVVQEAFIKLWESPQSWNPHKNTRFTTWFYRIVVNRCLDFNRRKPMIPITTSKSLLETPFTNKLEIDKTARTQLLNQFINELPKRQKIALNLCFYEGVSNKDAAEIVGVRLKALQSLIMRAKKTLREKLKPYQLV